MKILYPAVRQYRHDSSEIFVKAYDKKETEKIVQNLTEQINKLKKALAGGYNPDALTLITEALKDKGYDGLHFDDECGCALDDLAPCGAICAQCEAGYKVKAPPGAPVDWYICQNREDRPWE